MTIVRALAEAHDEIQAAAAWYEHRRVGLGEEFLQAFEAATVLIGQNPLQFAQMENNPSTRNVRRCLLKRFPYVVVFEVRNEECLVLAVAHARRKPNYWRKRVSDTSGQSSAVERAPGDDLGA
jgi:toxin ParE1/3/4